jgi:hypothetical protein
MRQICFATYEVTFNHCMEDGCKEHLLAASEFQEKVVAHYLADGVPPLREAYILATLPQDFIQNIAEECPPVVFFAYLLIAEATSVVDVAESQPFLVSAVSVRAATPKDAWAQYLASWPVDAALARVADFAAPGARQTLDVVVVRCREDVSWLASVGDLPGVRIFVYEKCGERADGGHTAVDLPDGDIRTDECSVYIAHARRADVAEYVAFLQADASDHWLEGLFDFVLAAVTAGTYRVPFLHLNKARMVSAYSQCVGGVAAALGIGLQSAPATYCCAQFVVARERLQAVSRDVYAAMDAMLADQVPEGCPTVPGHALVCMAFEVLWHALWGEPVFLPRRGRDTRLPVAFRVDEDRTTGFPNTYMQTAPNGALSSS